MGAGTARLPPNRHQPLHRLGENPRTEWWHQLLRYPSADLPSQPGSFDDQTTNGDESIVCHCLLGRRCPSGSDLPLRSTVSFHSPPPSWFPTHQPLPRHSVEKVAPTCPSHSYPTGCRTAPVPWLVSGGCTDRQPAKIQTVRSRSR